MAGFVLAGTVHDTVAWTLPAVAITLVGAAGTFVEYARKGNNSDPRTANSTMVQARPPAGKRRNLEADTLPVDVRHRASDV